MSAPFRDVDFLAGNWRTLEELACGTDSPFPAALPASSAVDFDKVKEAVCAYRGWELCSADAVTIAADGRILIIEFKDTRRNHISWLKKKGFDSLWLFWVAVGGSLTMDEIRDRAVFCYVSAEPERYDSELGGYLEEAGRGHRSPSHPDQLEELRNAGLYGEVKHLGPSDFCVMIQQARVASTVDEMKSRLTASYQLPNPRPALPTLDLTTSADLKRFFFPFAELRMMDPFDPKKHKKNPNGVLRVADTYDVAAETMTFRHDWTQPFPFMALTTRCFDSFALWCLALRADKRLDDLGGTLNGDVGFTGTPLPVLQEPPNTPHELYRHRHWEVYARCYHDKYGLSVFEANKLYGRLDPAVDVCFV